MLWMRQSDIDAGKHREDVCLQECHEQFEAVHKDKHEEADCRHRRSHACTYLPRDEDEARKRDYDRMAAKHVGEKTHHQCERLREDAYNLHDRHQRYGTLHHHRHLWPKYLLPILLVAEDVHEQERQYGQEHRYREVTRHVRAAGEYGQKPYEVRDEDKEEHRQQVGRIRAVVLLAYACLDDIVVDIHDEHLDSTAESLRRRMGILLAPTLVPACAWYKDEQHHGNVNPYLHHVLRYRNVPRAVVVALLIDLALALLVDVEAVVRTVCAVVEARRAENLPAAFVMLHNNGQRDMRMPPQMPFVGIAHVVEDDFLHVDGLLRPLRGGIGSAGDAQEQQQCNCYMSEYTHFRIYFLDENVLLRAQKYGKNSYPQTLSTFIIIMRWLRQPRRATADLYWCMLDVDKDGRPDTDYSETRHFIWRIEALW